MRISRRISTSWKVPLLFENKFDYPCLLLPPSEYLDEELRVPALCWLTHFLALPWWRYTRPRPRPRTETSRSRISYSTTSQKETRREREKGRKRNKERENYELDTSRARSAVFQCHLKAIFYVWLRENKPALNKKKICRLCCYIQTSVTLIWTD